MIVAFYEKAFREVTFYNDSIKWGNVLSDSVL